MRLKLRLLPALFLLALGAAQARDYTWRGLGTITVEPPDGWKIEGRPAKETGYVFVAHPAPDVAAFLQITLLTVPPGQLVLGELPDRLRDSLEPYIEQSVEKEFRPVALRSHQGKGWYAELTDAALVGKPPVAGDYKVMRSAIVALDEELIAVATMQFDDPVADAPGEMLSIVSSLRFKRDARAGR